MRRSTFPLIGFAAAAISIASMAAGLSAIPQTTNSAQPTSSTATTMRVDAVHSGINFRVTHFGVSYVPGRFNKFEGSFTLDPENLDACAITATAKAASVDTNSSGRDNHLKGPDFFDAENHPNITFKSTKWEKGADKDHFKVTGDLTLLGKTKSITVDLEHVGTTTGGRAGTRTGVYSVFAINRSEFGMNYGLDGAVEDEVQLTIAFEGVEAK